MSDVLGDLISNCQAKNVSFRFGYNRILHDILFAHGFFKLVVLYHSGLLIF